MSTRCNIIVKDDQSAIQIYRQWDGYPESVISTMLRVLKFAWPLPRFQVSDFSAAIVAAWKSAGGNIYIDGTPNGFKDLHPDVDYVYVISPPDAEIGDKYPPIEIYTVKRKKDGTIYGEPQYLETVNDYEKWTDKHQN